MSGERRSFADNQDGNTVAEALIGFAKYDRHRWPIAVASGYFDLSGFSVVAEMLEAAPSVRILLGTEPHPPRVRRSHEAKPASDEPIADAVAALQAALVVERDLLPFDAATARAIQRLQDFLLRPTTEVRLYRERFLHGKAFVFGHEAAVIAGSANFTANGLVHNLELDLGQFEPERVQQVRRWFDDLWERAEPYDLAAIFAARAVPYEPYEIYLRMLYELYGEEPELRDDVAVAPGQTGMRLATFQRLGVLRARRILDRYGGVLIADGVGLGKSFVAGGLIQHAVRDEGLRALLVTPASLRDSTWHAFLNRYQLFVENVSYQQLAADAQIGTTDPSTRQPHLKARADEYRLIVVDEAHAFRNPDTFHYRALRRLMAAGATPKQLVLLTATPVNNSLHDLYHQIMLFARHEAAFSDLGILSLRGLFETARKTDPDQLTPHLLFPLLDAVSVRRTRRHIQRFYANESIGDPPRPIAFPRPHLRSVRYALSATVPGLFDQVADAIEHRLTLAIYRPDAYRKAVVPTGRQEVLAALLRSQLLKRFESSLSAFATTVGRLVDGHDRFLDALARGVVTGRDLDSDEIPPDDEEDLTETTATDITELPAALYDTTRLRAEVSNDRAVLAALLSRAQSVTPRRDPKLLALTQLLQRLGRDPSRDNRKVVLFSYYADTVNYIKAYLDERPDDLGPYAARYASVTGASSPEERQRLVWSFAPKSSDAPPGRDDDRIDLVVATDALAEGQNLQQAGLLINFDLPWNPMRLVQRNGRIDRLWSDHADIYLYSFFPEAELDTLLRLEERLRAKIQQANAAVGVETPPLPGVRAAERVFADVEERIRSIYDEDESVLEAEERDVDAFSGELFREDLRRALLEGRESAIRSMPWGAGSGHQRGASPGVVFAARVGTERIWRFVPVSEDELRDDLLGLLDLVRCDPNAARRLPVDVERQLYVLWGRARDDIYEAYMGRLDPLTRQAAVPKAQRDAVTLLQAVVVQGASEAIAALQVPWPVQISRALRRLLHGLKRPDASPESIAREIVVLVRDEGLRPPPPSALPEAITPEEVHLVAFQVVSGG
jgi:hypothetical protein